MRIYIAILALIWIPLSSLGNNGKVVFAPTISNFSLDGKMQELKTIILI